MFTLRDLTNEDLEEAIIFATEMHKGQMDLQGNSYIHHPLRIMEEVRKAGLGIDYQIVALLHDVLEDCDIILETMLKYVPLTPRMFAALDAITHRKGVPYETYLEDVITSTIATVVKWYDVEDNSNRLGDIEDPNLFDRLNKKYSDARGFLDEFYYDAMNRLEL